MSEVIVCANHKGGTGKTSIVANLGGLFAKAGCRVAIVDLDPQANQAEELGYVGSAFDDDGMDLAGSLLSGDTPTPARNVRECLDVFVGGQAVTKARKTLMGIEADEGEWSTADRLRACIAPVRDDYDYIFIDVPPSPEELLALGLVAADWLLLPLQEDESSRKGLRAIAGIMGELAEAGHPTPDVAGVVIFNAGSRSGTTSVAKQRERLQADLGSDVSIFDTFIRTAKAASLHARTRGLLAHEVEIDLTENAAKYKAQVFADLRAGQPTTPKPGTKTVQGLASDYEALAMELQSRINHGEV